MHPNALLTRMVVVALSAAVALMTGSAAVARSEETVGDAHLLIYHQITARPAESAPIYSPILSADGARAVFSAFVTSDDPAVYGTTTISAINADGTGLTDVDRYETLCNCDAVVDVSADGETIVSSDGVQVRVAGAGGGQELVAFSDRQVDALRITADGRTVFFLVGDDGTTRGDDRELGRGVWAIDTDGGDLRQVASGEAVAAVIGVPVEEVFFYLDAQSLDVSDDGTVIVFGAYAYDAFQNAHYAFVGSGAGGAPRLLVGPVDWLHRLAGSGDGATMAYDVTPPGADNAVDDHEVVVVGSGGSARTVLTASRSAAEDDWLQLNADGTRLLVGPDSLLIDTVSGEMEQLAVKTLFLPYDWTVLTDGLDAASMSADATRFLYVMVTDACCYVQQLATLDLDPIDLGDAPLIAEATINQATVSLDGEETAIAYAYIEAISTPLHVGVVALREGRHDVNVGYDTFLTDDGQGADAEAGDGLFTGGEVGYGEQERRGGDDTGPRLVRIQAEVEDADGFRRATAIEFGPLTVVSS